MEAFRSKRFKFRIITVFLVTVSFLSMTFAWFAYSGRSSLNTEVGVRSWFLELEKDGSVVSNAIEVSFDDLHPGMETVVETVKITNMGDSVADLDYSIKHARILGDSADDFTLSDSISSEFIEDAVSNNYPFKIDMSLSKQFVQSGSDVAYFNISISWPMDSGNNELDGVWGSKAYDFKESEQLIKDGDSSYNIRSSIDLSLSLSAEQYFGADDDNDVDFAEGRLVLFNPYTYQSCSKISSSCLITHVLDTDSKVSDTEVRLLVDTTSDYRINKFSGYSNSLRGIEDEWHYNINLSGVSANDLLNLISDDVINSKLVQPGLSDSIIGETNYGNRAIEKLNGVVLNNGYFQFSNLSFDYLNSVDCYWTTTEYDFTRGYAVVRENTDTSKLYPEDKNTSCSIIPVITVNKDLVR